MTYGANDKVELRVFNIRENSAQSNESAIYFSRDGEFAGGPRLVEPAGLFNNRKWVGYVPPTSGETALGDQLISVNGIFELPADRAVTIAPADPQGIGRGNSAYIDNVGGLLIESSAGDMSFIPQWTKDGYAQDSIALTAGEARRIIYAHVGQNAYAMMCSVMATAARRAGEQKRCFIRLVSSSAPRISTT